MAALCREFDISRQAGYKWLSRYREHGVAGVVERSRRPRTSPGRTTDELEQRVVEQRRKRPDWGARKLQVMLAREGVEASFEQVRIGLIEYDNGRTTAFEVVRLGADLASAQRRLSEALVRAATAAADLRYLTAESSDFVPDQARE